MRSASRCICFVLGLAWAGWGMPAAAFQRLDPETFAEQVDQTLADTAYQTDLPVPETKLPPEPLFNVNLPAWVGTVLGWLVIGAAIIGVAFVLNYVLRAVLDAQAKPGARSAAAPRSSPVRKRAIAPPPQPAAPAERPDLAMADRLAQEGRFTEAIHALLLTALDFLAQRQGRTLDPALTGREAAAELAVPTPQRTVLRQLVAAVERALFAGHTPDADTYARSRASFERLMKPEAAA